MLFVGLDLHKDYSEFAIMDNDGRLIKHGRVENSLEDMSRFSNILPLSTPIAMESSSTWYWSYKLLSERHMASLSNPVKNKAIASAKVKADTLGNIQFFFIIKEKQLCPTTGNVLPTVTYTELTKDYPE